jgi:type II secretory pathway component GspD/PulD (secretin)
LVLGSTDAERIYQQAREAEQNGLTVRAYLLYSQLAAIEPKNQLFALKAAGLKPLALKAVHIAEGPTAPTVTNPDHEGAAISEGARITDQDMADAARMAGPTLLQAPPGTQDFHLKGEPKNVWEQVAAKFELVAVFDRDYPSQPPFKFDLDGADYRTAIHALEAATNSFVVPVSPRVILIAQDTQQKRTDLESNEAVMIPIPDNASVQEAQEMATMIQQTIEMKRFVVDAHKRMVFMRDRVSKVEAARALTAQLLHAKPQVSIEVEFLNITESSSLSVGITWQTQFPLVYFGNLWKNAGISIPSGFTNFLTFGGGATLFGIGLTGAQVFATASRNSGTSVLNASITVADGQPGTLHVGDKYPIIQSGYYGAPPDAKGQVFAPPPVVNFEDLGVVLKVTPEVHSDSEVSLDLNAEYKVLGSASLNGIPVVSNRKFEAKLRMTTSEYAIVAGLITDSHTETKSGFAGLSSIPLLGWFFRKTDKTHDYAQTLLVLKPHIVIAPPSDYITREIWVGSDNRPLTPL